MFNVGDLITGTDDNHYGITDKKGLYVVIRVYNPRQIKIAIVAYKNGHSGEFDVEAIKFKLCTYEEFISKYPSAPFSSSCPEEVLNRIKRGDENMKKAIGEITKMNKERFGTYVLTDEERSTLRSEIISLLEEYGYHPTTEGVDKIIDEWIKNKGWIVNLFKNHPNYNGKFQITFDSDYDRICDKNALQTFANWVYDKRKSVMKEYMSGIFSYKEIYNILKKLDNVIDLMTRLERYGSHICLTGKTLKEYEEEREDWRKKENVYRNLYRENPDEYYVEDHVFYTKESYEIAMNVSTFSDHIYEFRQQLATKEFAERINGLFPSIKAVEGQKVSRIVGKVCKLLGLNKDEDYNKEYAKYCDAINPLAIKRHTILSCHPIDYFTMSFGNSWSSCHTIDKKNKRGMENGFNGQYSSGTLSYMLDESSFVYYTVDKEYNGDKLELEPKINRNMFHIGEDKLIQARVYPQATDGAEGIYKQIREIAQKVIADCLAFPNLWKNVKGKNECSSMIISNGTHYKDYVNFSDCNVSYLKLNEDELFNRASIYVGHSPICPKCGDEHSYEGCVECRPCYENKVTCSCCDYSYNRNDMHEIDGEWYCLDCCFYCSYHEQWEVDFTSSIRINDYGRVCQEALEEESNFVYCEHCGEWYVETDRNFVKTEDGHFYCCQSCARREGYAKTADGKWYPSCELHICEECNTCVHMDDWNDEHNCCNNCVSRNSNEEREAV